MSITDVTFLFIFLPIALVTYLVKTEWQKYILLLLSLFFYACGSPRYFVLFVLAVAVNVLVGYGVSIRSRNLARIFLILGIAFDVSLLFYYKYYDFTIENVNHIFGTDFQVKNLLLPLGISFFVFKAISFLVDVYRGQVELKKNPVYSALYLSFFAQIASGPICRYGDFYATYEQELSLKDKFTQITGGGYLFARGFAKKMVLANVLSHIVAEVFATDIADTSKALLWLGSLSFSLYLYYDFSGYSDMAIGIGQMFGIQCPENFNYPYITASVSEFWRRWHISLGTWFKEYIYFPLGGSRVNSKVRLYFNLFVVWFLTGIWHGANWNFIAWGLFYFVLIAFEKTTGWPKNFRTKIMKIVYRLLTLLFINFQWVLFNSTDLYSGLRYIKHMLISPANTLADRRALILFGEYGIFVLAGIILAMPVIPWLKEKASKNKTTSRVADVVCAVILCGLFLWALSFVVAGQNNPFMYANF